MAKTKPISKEQRAQIQILHEAGGSHREIARFMGVSKTGVVTTIKRYAETKSFDDRTRSGWPRKTSATIDKYILMISKRDRFKTARDIASEINEING